MTEIMPVLSTFLHPLPDSANLEDLNASVSAGGTLLEGHVFPSSDGLDQYHHSLGAMNRGEPSLGMQTAQSCDAPARGMRPHTCWCNAFEPGSCNPCPHLAHVTRVHTCVV